jgi:ABC-type molybdate transport system permease subunit
VTDWTAAELAIVWLSLKVASVATLASVIPAVAVAWWLARGRFWGGTILNVIIHLPLVVPPVVTGYVLLRVFGRRGPVGAWLEQYLGFQFSFRWTGAALAAGVMAFPLVVRAIPHPDVTSEVAVHQQDLIDRDDWRGAAQKKVGTRRPPIDLLPRHRKICHRMAFQ